MNSYLIELYSISLFIVILQYGNYAFYMRKVSLFVFLLFTFILNAKNNDSVIKKLNEDWLAQIKFKNGYLNVNFATQMWNVVSLKYPSNNFPPKYDMFLRRARFGVSGKIIDKLSYTCMFHFDGLGKDRFTVSQGVLNSDSSFRFAIRDFFFSYKFSNRLNFTLGYIRPRVGKEAIYSSWFCISQEKSLPNYQPRTHIYGRPIGREMGFNLGGLLHFNSKFHLLYDTGIFDMNSSQIVGGDSINGLLKTVRCAFMIGDPEMKDYSLVYYQSGLRARKGLTIGINGCHQGATSVFKNNSFFGVDFQLNYGPFDFIFEQDWMYRTKDQKISKVYTRDQVNSFKLAWNFLLKNNTIIQPNLMYSSELPDYKYVGQNPFTKSVKQYVSDFGINWLINKDRLKLGLHYIQGKQYYNNLSKFAYTNLSLQFMI